MVWRGERKVGLGSSSGHSAGKAPREKGGGRWVPMFFPLPVRSVKLISSTTQGVL